MVRKAPYHGDRDGVFGVELLTAGRLPVFEMAGLWLDFIKGANTVADIRSRACQVRWRLDQNMASIDQTVMFNDHEDVVDANEDVLELLVQPRTGSHVVSCQFTTSTARTHMEKAFAATIAGDWLTVVEQTRSALSFCPQLTAAHRCIGIACFRHGADLAERELFVSTRFLFRRRVGLRSAIDGLCALWKNKRSPQYEDDVSSAVKAFNHELHEFEDIYEAAEAWLHRGLF